MAYSQIRKIGSGASGVVHLVEDEKGQRAVMKTIQLNSKSDSVNAVQEMTALSRLRHPYIVRYREAKVVEGDISLIFEYCDGGDLLKKMNEHLKLRKRIKESVILKWLSEIALALVYVHSKQIIHRDIKCSNIFLDSAGNDVKLGDFGICKSMSTTFTETFLGTANYMSPEVLKGDKYTYSSDVWSLGCVVYELCTLKSPFKVRNLQDMMSLAESMKEPPVIPTGYYSAQLSNLCKSMMCINPKRRPTAAEIIKFPAVRQTIEDMRLSLVQKNEEKKVAFLPGKGDSNNHRSSSVASTRVPSSSPPPLPNNVSRKMEQNVNQETSFPARDKKANDVQVEPPERRMGVSEKYSRKEKEKKDVSCIMQKPLKKDDHQKDPPLKRPPIQKTVTQSADLLKIRKQPGTLHEDKLATRDSAKYNVRGVATKEKTRKEETSGLKV